MYKKEKIGLIIPCLNEIESIPALLKAIPKYVDKIVVVDNGSTDGSYQYLQERTQDMQSLIVCQEMERGYGAACLLGMRQLNDCGVIVFLDADLSDYPETMNQLLDPLCEDSADIVISNRFSKELEKGALSPPQHFGNKFSVFLIRLFWRFRYHDLGPFRAIKQKALQNMRMKDRNYGWTIEMQVKAIQQGLRIGQVDLPYRCRYGGRSKVSGTIRGVLGAGFNIVYLILKYKLRELLRRKG